MEVDPSKETVSSSAAEGGAVTMMMDTDDEDNNPADANNSTTSNTPSQKKRDSLNGCWILDKTRGNWSMRGYLETLNVNELAIEAHEKGEKENETYHTITLDNKHVTIVKRSRVNADLTIDLILGQEKEEFLKPGSRPKRSLATSDGLHHLQITSSLHTMNGIAEVTDIKIFQPHINNDYNKCEMIQTLTIINKQTGQSNTTTRHFIPYLDTPPHLMKEE